MAAPEAESAEYEVGDLRVDAGRQRVTRAGSEIALPNLSFELLLALIRAAPNLLSNDSLMARVWPGQVVSPETVAKRVNLLRTALGDDAQEPRYIAGVRGRGYRLVAAVSPVLRPAPSVESAAVVESRPVTAKSRRIGWLVAAGLLAGAVVVVVGVRALSSGRAMGVASLPGNPQGNAGSVSAPERTVAVLPFDNISANPADAYLAQGFPEMILNRLSRINGLAVIARNSSFALPTRNIDSSEIGRRLNSGYLVAGSVQREADRLRVAVHLVESATGTQVWSARFDRGMHDIFSIEDEIADQIADALSVRLGAGVPKPPAGARSSNLEAYLTYLQGRTLLGRYTVAESEAAVPYFEKAIAMDPGFAPAYASLFDARMQVADYRLEDLNVTRQRYRHLLDRALELDPTSGAAYLARAMWADQPYHERVTGDSPSTHARELDFRKGAALDPSNGRGLTAYAEFLYWELGLREQAKGVLNRALWVDPMSPRARYDDAEFSIFDPGVRASERKFLQVLELDPNFVPALQYYAQLRWIIDGRLAEAIHVIEHAIALDPKNLPLRHFAMKVYLDLDDVQAARAVIAAMPSGAREAGLLALHEGDWRRAGLAAFDESAWSRDSDQCEIWQSAALRDYALQTGELQRAIALMRVKYEFGDAPEKNVGLCTSAAAVRLAELLAAAGQAGQARSLRRAASTWNDANEAKLLADSHSVRAELLLFDGKQDAALAELAESFRSGYYARWWYTIKYDPTWVPLHGDARFQAIAADVRRYVDGQRNELEDLRRQGAVPRR